MTFKPLERLFITERVQQRAARTGGFSVPAMNERLAQTSDGPFLVTNMRGAFLLTRPSGQGVLRFGFSHCPLDNESHLLVALHRTLVTLSESESWSNRCKTVRDAVYRMRSHGLEPRSIVISPALLGDMLPEMNLEQAWERMGSKGEVAEVEGVHIMMADMLEGTALVATIPTFVGTYVRTGDYVGVMVHNADRSLVTVVP